MTQFTPSAAQRVADATREVERRIRNRPSRRARWFRTGGGGGGRGNREVMFELYELLAPGGTARAYPRTWDTASSDYITNYAADTFPVVDQLSRFRGRGVDALESPDNFGSRGMATVRNGVIQIEYLQPHATGIKCVVVTRSEDPAADIEVESVVITKPIKFALLMTPVESVVNRHRWAVDTITTGDVITAEWDDDLQRMAAIQEDC